MCMIHVYKYMQRVPRDFPRSGTKARSVVLRRVALCSIFFFCFFVFNRTKVYSGAWRFGMF